ncbi:MAG: hypothetical protein H7099_16675 [Gemmatimonadaceae bacterium]|nr:hypothetical protein [Gemmatimonadaceae bacterium]
MIAFRDPPPLPVRVRSLKASAEAPPVFESPFVPWLVSILLMIGAAFVGSQLRTERTQKEVLVGALANGLPRQVEHGIVSALPLGTSMRDVRDRLAAIRTTCRSDSVADTVTVCLGAPIVRANSFSRTRVRLIFRAGTLRQVNACPTFVHWSRTPVPSELADRVAHPPRNDCWRDDANLADNAWTYATLPDRAFTTVTVHGADSARRKSAPTPDTLIVRW